MASNSSNINIHSKVLILKSDKTEFEQFYINHMQMKNVDTFPIYKVKAGLFWYMAVIWIEKLQLPFGSVFYSKWKKSLKNYDTVIVFDRNLNWNIFKYIKRKNKSARCIAWYWNPIRKEKRAFPKKYQEFCEVWSFDQSDCNRYGYKKNVQFYFNNIVLDEDNEKLYDAVFVGVDKGRYDTVKSIASKLQECGKRVFIGVVADYNSKVGGEYIGSMEYEKILCLLNKCKCIIDIPQENQEGLTLRVIEAMFLNKKLITTNEKILNCDFFDDSNILVWNNPNNEEIIRFFERKWVNCDNSIRQKYSFEGWLKEFGL